MTPGVIPRMILGVILRMILGIIFRMMPRMILGVILRIKFPNLNGGLFNSGPGFSLATAARLGPIRLRGGRRGGHRGPGLSGQGGRAWRLGCRARAYQPTHHLSSLADKQNNRCLLCHPSCSDPF